MDVEPQQFPTLTPCTAVRVTLRLRSDKLEQTVSTAVAMRNQR